MDVNSYKRALTGLPLIYLYGLLLIFACTGCKKFLDVEPNVNANTNPHLVSDFEQMLNNANLASPNYLAADLMSDDIALPDNFLSNFTGLYYTKAYQWWPVLWDASESDPMYTNDYQMIFQCNLILDRLHLAPDGTTAQKNIIAAQARINRAYYYFQLSNLYGKAYDAATAAQDLAVPLVLKPDASLLPKRATVQQVYSLILEDLQQAINTADLPDFGADVIHPGRAAALALQARVHLFMGNYEQALASANAALNIKSTLLDYNNFSMVSGTDPSQGVLNKPVTLKDETSNPETLLARINLNRDFYNTASTSFMISTELLTLFGSNDLRLVYNFTRSNNTAAPTYFYYFDESFNVSIAFNYGIGVPEMLLTKAECLARQGDAATALAQVELIRKFRYAPADYVPLVNSGAEDALKQVLTERRKELFLHGGLRLFDLKRLNRDPRFAKDIERISDTDGHTIATLKPGAPAYLFPFAPQIIAANPSIIQNPR